MIKKNKNGYYVPVLPNSIRKMEVPMSQPEGCEHRAHWANVNGEWVDLIGGEIIREIDPLYGQFVYLSHQKAFDCLAIEYKKFPAPSNAHRYILLNDKTKCAASRYIDDIIECSRRNRLLFYKNKKKGELAFVAIKAMVPAHPGIKIYLNDFCVFDDDTYEYRSLKSKFSEIEGNEGFQCQDYLFDEVVLIWRSRYKFFIKIEEDIMATINNIKGVIAKCQQMASMML